MGLPRDIPIGLCFSIYLLLSIIHQHSTFPPPSGPSHRLRCSFCLSISRSALVALLRSLLSPGILLLIPSSFLYSYFLPGHPVTSSIFVTILFDFSYYACYSSSAVGVGYGLHHLVAYISLSDLILLYAEYTEYTEYTKYTKYTKILKILCFVVGRCSARVI